MPGKTSVVAYCGLCCEDCFAREARVADMAEALRKELKKVGFKRFAEAVSEVPYFEALKKYPDFCEVLDTLGKARCGKLCRDGGGGPACQVRICCREKKIEGCWECGEFVECEKLKFLEPVHGIGHIRNLRRIKRNGVDGFLKGKRDWYAKPPAK